MDDLHEQLDHLYQTLPAIQCRRKCQRACGPIMMSEAESERIAERVGRQTKETRDLSCPMLSIMGHCSIYDIRPAICRIYGLTPALRCEFGCVPERWLSDAESSAFLRRVMRLGAQNRRSGLAVGPWVRRPSERPTGAPDAA